MNINFAEVLVLNYLLKNKDHTINEYNLYNNIKEFEISSTDMVVEIIKLKDKGFLEERNENENKGLILTSSGVKYAANVVNGRLEYLESVIKHLNSKTEENKETSLDIIESESIEVEPVEIEIIEE